MQQYTLSFKDSIFHLNEVTNFSRNEDERPATALIT